ncbi:TetR/AcrR family transcriptional regulator [Rhodococcus qingshengii]|jgi:AcrR family transcriptional regulator|uniref:TetR/AcrR family transcriptional regulator n=1 Tax=Rhodococcus qingshengii TaxID=334542 RepID=A0AAW6LIQ9_RHOSG|nr:MULTISPECIES: TetR/AcrR family transcriptional regulator [Rhodococcus]AUS34797.1 TetR/AcrR family transcriptional regulator [Rhodococcus qingshengii]MBT9298878.1 TetR/AcrR family transcriptional regulator [Rhodococcus sp. GOMB7]MCC4301669.1 TetR/AcrR family transcriptional regulator [Rhodococcus sp. 3-2]MCD2132561.1 TetR/AcrR family transcriptional regulator [Rhodococcus qingshengii]MCJ0897956.1 TetR/AcrR family transcriptional regulator [Rhodococcus sp. ARC_M13]|eukprot:gene24537-29429_t
MRFVCGAMPHTLADVAIAETDRNYGGRSVAARKAERRSLFLNAALSVFADQGYAGSSVADICASASLARRQFYDEFGSREDLLLALYDQIQLDARIAMVDALDAEPSVNLRDKAATAMAAFVESVGSDPRRAHVAFIDVVGVSPRVEKHRVDQRSVWATFFESIIKGIVGEDYEPPGGYRWASTAFIGALTALVHQWSTAEPRPPVSVLVDLMTVLLNALIDDAPLRTDE